MGLYDALDTGLPVDVSALDPNVDDWAAEHGSSIGQPAPIAAPANDDPFAALEPGPESFVPISFAAPESAEPAPPAQAPAVITPAAPKPAPPAPARPASSPPPVGSPPSAGHMMPAPARAAQSTVLRPGTFITPTPSASPDSSPDENLFTAVITPEDQERSRQAAELAARIAALTPGAPVSAAELMSEHDKEMANEIERELTVWESQYTSRVGSQINPEARADALANLVSARRNELIAPDDVVISYVLNLAEGLFGFEALLDKPEVSDILINDADAIFVEERGVLSRRQSPLRSRADLEVFVNRLLNRTGGSLSLSEPILDEQFEWEAPYGKINVRVHIELGSLTVTGAPAISLRKPVASGFDHLETWATRQEDESDSPLSPEAAEFLAMAFRARASVLVVGGTGSGKTSLLKALLRQIDAGERIVVIEESNELDFRGIIPNYVGLIANQAPNQRIQHLLRSAMRMRPDRIIVGELRDGNEVDGFIRAINTGHAGSISTIHASSAKDGLQAMLTLAAQNSSSKSSVEHIGRLIHPGIDLIVYLAAQPTVGPDGRTRRTRRVMEIATINEFSVRDGVPDFALQHVFARSVGQMGTGGRRILTIDAPMRSFGYAGLSDTFVTRMRTFGLTEADLRGVLDAGVH